MHAVNIMGHEYGCFKLCTTSLLVLAFFSFLVYLRFSSTYESEFTHKTLPRARYSQRVKPPVLLLWTTFFGKADYYFGLGVDPFKQHCNCTCELTTDKKRFSKSSAIIVHPRDSIQPFPQQRLPWQRFVFFLLESPIHSPSMKRYGSVFNWTMTYRRDSDVFMPYGELKVRTGHSQTIKNYAKGKTKLVVMVNSNCSPPSKRQNYVKHLSQYIQVDTYGACGKKRCPGNCTLIQEYKFYLSFENTICKDYVTEKLWFKAFDRGLVPIVLGGSDYSSILPPHSFIDIADYNSPKELADHLKIINANDTLYNRYFAWRQTLETNRRIAFCDLCYKIKNGASAKVYTDLDGWWRNGACITPEKKYHKLVKFFQNLV